MRLPNSSLNFVGYRNCVLDPTLALSFQGVAIASSLSQVLNIWIARELWHILNNIDLYLQKPELVLSQKIIPKTRSPQAIAAKEELWHSLKKWETLRNQRDLIGLNLFWLGDSLRESLLPTHQDRRVLQEWEFLASCLDRQIDLDSSPSNVLTLAFRDAVAMTATLDSAFILTACLPSPQNTGETLPEICQSLENWGISCHLIPSSELSLTPELEYWRQLFASIGLTKLIWTGVSFAIVQIILPAIPKTHYFPSNTLVYSSKDAHKLRLLNNFSRNPNFWVKSQCFWYPIYT